MGWHFHEGGWGLFEKLGGVAMTAGALLTGGAVGVLTPDNHPDIVGNPFFTAGVVLAALGFVVVVVGIVGGEVERRRSRRTPQAPSRTSTFRGGSLGGRTRLFIESSADHVAEDTDFAGSARLHLRHHPGHPQAFSPRALKSDGGEAEGAEKERRDSE